MKRKKVLIIGVVITVILLFTVGVTYAFFNYSQTGTSNSQLIVGDIYMHFKETNQLTIENAMPYSVSYSYKHNSNMTEEEVNACVTYFETSDEFGPGFIEYLIANGESIETFCDGTGTVDGLTFQQLLDEDVFLEEHLTYFEENNIIKLSFSGLPYFEFTIDGKNTYTEEDIWYEIVLSHGDSHATRTERIRDDLLKFRLVEVVDGEEQELFTNRSYNDLTSKRVWVDTIPRNTTSEVVHTYRLYMWISDDTIIGNTSDADYDIDTWNNEVYASIKVNVTGDFNEKEVAYEDMYDVTDASCFTTETYTQYLHNSNISNEEVSACVSYLTSNLGDEEGEIYESFCQGTGTLKGDTFQQALNEDWFSEEELTYFAENNIIIVQEERIAITDYDSSCGSDVIIPKTINDYNVTKIGIEAFYDKQLASVVIPDSVISIGDHAFSNNQLTSVVIPDSVTSIEWGAFSNNQLTSVVIPDSVNDIHSYAFTNNNLIAVTIPDSVTYLGCKAFDDTVEITKRDDLVCDPIVN